MFSASKDLLKVLVGELGGVSTADVCLESGLWKSTPASRPMWKRSVEKLSALAITYENMEGYLTDPV